MRMCLGRLFGLKSLGRYLHVKLQTPLVPQQASGLFPIYTSSGVV